MFSAAVTPHKRRSGAGILVYEGREVLRDHQTVIGRCRRGGATEEVLARIDRGQRRRITGFAGIQSAPAEPEFDSPKFRVSVQLIPLHQLRREIKPDVGPTRLQGDTFGIGPVKFDPPLPACRGRQFETHRQRDPQPRDHAPRSARRRANFERDIGLIPITRRTGGCADVRKFHRTHLRLLRWRRRGHREGDPDEHQRDQAGSEVTKRRAMHGGKNVEHPSGEVTLKT